MPEPINFQELREDSENPWDATVSFGPGLTWSGSFARIVVEIGRDAVRRMARAAMEYADRLVAAKVMEMDSKKESLQQMRGRLHEQEEELQFREHRLREKEESLTKWEREIDSRAADVHKEKMELGERELSLAKVQQLIFRARTNAFVKDAVEKEQ